MKRVRVWLASWLLRGTECSVARTKQLHEVTQSMADLRDEIQRAGGMPDVSHVRAYRKILRSATEATVLAGEMVVRA